MTTNCTLRRVYSDKQRCFECGQEGHLSYKCPSNVLGAREPPPKKIRKTRADKEEEAFKYWNDEDSDKEEVCKQF